MPRRAELCAALPLVAALLLSACASRRDAGTPDNEPTLATLAKQKASVTPDPGQPASTDEAIAAYRQFLAGAPRTLNPAQRAEAMRRLGDLEMDRVDQRIADGRLQGSATDWREAVARYEAYLKEHPRAPDADRVLYQLARAHELGGELDQARKLLDRMVADHPATALAEEAQFRRGELLFTQRQWASAEAAYSRVLEKPNPYAERAMYMQGWSRFKQGRLPEALSAFFGVLDAKLGANLSAADAEEPTLEKLASLSRADRELVDDTLRVVGISLDNGPGAAGIAPLVDSPVRHRYDFRLYQHLAGLYLKQDRPKDAADTLGLFARLKPLHAQAPLLQARVIEIHESSGFASQALQAKKDYVATYGIGGDFRRSNPEGWQRARALVKTHLRELARHHHALAQQTKSRAMVQEAAHWYRAFIESFPQDDEAPQSHFLLAELLFDDRAWDEAARHYEASAYAYAAHAKSADAGYAALLAHAERSKAAATAAQPAAQREAVASAQRFAKAFSQDPRATPVLANASQTLFSLGDAEPARALARQVLQRQPEAAQRRTVLAVLAHSDFDRQAWADAERTYAELLSLTPERDAQRGALQERLAASAYKQGEAAVKAGGAREAVAHYDRVAQLAPAGSVRAAAQYDAASTLLGLKDWSAAAQRLEALRRSEPQHALVAQVPAKLALAYHELGRWADAAAEVERQAAQAPDAEIARAARWQAAQLYDRASQRGGAQRAWEAYVRAHPQPLDAAQQARWRLATLAREDNKPAQETAWLQQLVQAHAAADANQARSERSRSLAAVAALKLTQPRWEAYAKLALVEPLAKSLAQKKARMQELLDAYAVASREGTAEASAAAAFHTAVLYADFSRAMMASQRPRKLSKAELEQYNVMLEEQALPFEDKALALHEANAARAAAGQFDEWVQASYTALRTLRPVRYAKTERSTEVIDAIH